MSISIKVTAFDGTGIDKIVTKELPEYAEKKYLQQFRDESAEYIKQAEDLANPANLLYWTEADEIILQQADKIKKRRAEVLFAITGYMHKLNQETPVHQPLTRELVEERRAVMHAAAQIHRDNLQHFTGEIAEKYEKAIRALEQRADGLTVYEGLTAANRYV